MDNIHISLKVDQHGKKIEVYKNGVYFDRLSTTANSFDDILERVLSEDEIKDAAEKNYHYWDVHIEFREKPITPNEIA